MIYFLLKQNRNKWHSLGWLLQLQLTILIIVVAGFLISRLGKWIATLPYENYQLGIAIFSTLILIQSISAFFIFRHTLPREKQLHVFYGLPLSQNQTRVLVAWYYYKYQLPIVVLLFVITLALAVAYPLTGFFTLAISLLSGYLIYLFSVRLYLFMLKLPNHDWHLEEMFPLQAKNHNKKNVLKLIGTSLSSYGLLKKEILSLWRNPFYRKLKTITWFFYITVLSTVYYSGTPEPDKWMMLFSVTVFWAHYNVHFNTKYISADPEWYFRSLPVSYGKVWLAKFSAEIFYILILLISQWIFLIFTGTEWFVQLNWIGALLLFAIIVLSIVIDFQILFYDNPRLAGYAYHFTLLFVLIMSQNYRFVGPLTAIILLTFYFFKTYRFYNS